MSTSSSEIQPRMSTSSSEWTKVREERNPIGSLAESLLSAISEIIRSVQCLQIERDAFTEISCYLYRASMVIMELRINWNTETLTIESLQSLLKKVDSAKSFTAEVEKTAHKVQPYEVGSIVHELENVIRSMGENLSMMSSSVYGHQDYIEKAAKALSMEMKDVSFTISQSHQCSEIGIGKGKETDLYAVDVDESAMSFQLSDYSQMYTPERKEISKIIDMRNDSKTSSVGSSLMSLPQLAQYMEPTYDTFFCPLTRRMMDDPVTIESGVSYERKAITEFFDKFQDPKHIVCPKSGQKLNSVHLSSNMALKATIDEWKERNEAARIKVARAALALGSTENMLLEAIDDLRRVCEGKPYNKVQVCGIGIIPLLANLVGYQSRNVRCATLELLRQLAEDDEDGQDIIARTVDISLIIKMLSSGHVPARHAAALLLLELTRTQFLHDRIGTVAGGILMLIRVKYRQSDAFTSEMADRILKNLERLPHNIKLMAENGYWEPLLSHLVEGDEEMRIVMAGYLAEIVPGPDSKTYVAERASPALIQMVQNGNSLTRMAAFKSLKQISGSHPNAKILIEAGIMQTMIEEIFRTTIHNEPIHSKTEAAAILANILESGADLENLQVNSHGHTISSDYIVYDIIGTIKNSTPDDLNINLIRIVICLIKVPRAAGTVISVVKETEASYCLIELINTPNEELAIASIKLLTTLSAFMGHTLSDRLCKTRGQPENLIQDLTEITRITEKDAVSAIFLAKLPHQNLTLNLALVNNSIVPIVMKHINQIQRTGTRSSRHASAYFEGLVGILCRLTTTLYDHQMLFTARTYNFTSVLTELLTRSFSDEVQKLSAVGLENLSKQSTVLSRPPRWKKTKILRFFFFKKCISINLSKDKNSSLCPIHGGVCTSQETFCLLDAEAVERLLACMDHENVEVIQAALSALSTLLDDNVNIEKSLSLLSEKDTIQHVLNALKEHKEEALWQKAFWVIEKFLTKGGDESFSNISQDRLLPGTLVSAFHHGDDCTREMAEKILRHLNRMPTLSNNTMSFNT